MTKYTAKPGIDWVAIEARVRAGEAALQIAKDHEVSCQAISKRARKEGWRKTALQVRAETEFKPAAVNGKGRPETKLAIIHALEKGVQQKTAAGVAGIAEDTLLEWKTRDPAFREECQAAVQRFIQTNLGRVDKAADRGDWKAATWMLGKHPASKPDYAEDAIGKGGAVLNIILNIPKPGQATIEAAEVQMIDVTPDKPRDD